KGDSLSPPLYQRGVRGDFHASLWQQAMGVIPMKLATLSERSDAGFLALSHNNVIKSSRNVL
ncbi:MAG: hypothetical protein Q7I93_03300, partial [Syntrophales bacterium]|nr:hypothetical protein [Syntrophales bacterium]